jgi:hypothetical protein
MTWVLVGLGGWILLSALLLVAVVAPYLYVTRRDEVRHETARRAAAVVRAEQLDLVEPGVPERRDPTAPRSVATRPADRMVH